MLHVTNGDSVLAGFREGAISGTCLAWRDVLHDGPVPQIEELPFLSAALTRCLEDYPSARDGLSRTERQLLEAGASGARHRRDYYVASSNRESCPWGDLSVYARLDRLLTGPGPAVDRPGPDEFVLDERGRRILAGEEDWFREAGRDAWIGGVHLDAGARRQWRWDGRTIVSTS